MERLGGESFGLGRLLFIGVWKGYSFVGVGMVYGGGVEV